MKKIFILIVSLGLLYPDRPFAQNSIKLYPYQMPPSHHPDYQRHHVKSPDASFFNNKIQFIALRDLSGDYKQKLDQWVVKDKLGDILWVSYPLVFQDNLKEVVAEIKRRNLYLFDLWGYIPGSGPGGYWTQFVIPDGVLDLFEKELGDHWLGMDNGEQDGRYVGSFAPRMYPLGADRKQQYFNFQRHYGAEVKEIKTRSGQRFVTNLNEVVLREGDTLVVMADDTFIPTWGESSVFVLLTNGNDPDTAGKKKRWLALILLVLMIVGATIGELPVTKEMFPDIKLDMFFFVSITTIVMAWTNLFPARKYTKYISWDILITIACAFAISKVMVNSGVADSVAKFIIGLSDDYGPHVLLAMLFIITNLFTELITNNAAAALAFPLALSIAAQLGVSPTPFFVVICMAASASFSTPIGYQTNLIVQGIGNYKFMDFVRIGLPLNIITFIISVILIPMIWNF